MAKLKQSKAKAKAEKPKKKPLIQCFDKDGNRIGDDGYLMTPVRKRMHRIFDSYLVAGFIVALFCLFCIVFSYFQGQSYSYLELRATGGTQLNGWDFAFLLRVEAVYCLLVAITFIASSIIGFHWLYEKRHPRRLLVLLSIEAIASVAISVFAMFGVGIAEPISLLSILFFVYTLYSMGAVSAERPSLKKAKVAKRVVQE